MLNVYTKDAATNACRQPGSDAVPLVHTSVLRTWTDFLGTDARGGMGRARLLELRGTTDTAAAYVPCRALCAWVAQQSSVQGLDNIGLRVADRAGLDALPASVVATVAAEDTLHAGLRTFCAEAGRVDSHAEIWLLDRPEAIHICHRGSFGMSVAGQIEMTWWTLGMLVHLVRLFLGPDWQPSLMGVPGVGRGTFAKQMLTRTRFIAQTERSWIAIARRRLDARPRQRPSPSTAPAPAPPHGFIGSLRYTLRSYLHGGHPSIEFAASIAGMSVRTLQRRLEAHGRTYTQVVDEARYGLATELLLNPDAKILDVAYDTGYTDPSHFSRAFRRLAGASPREYRQAAWAAAGAADRRGSANSLPGQDNPQRAFRLL